MALLQHPDRMDLAVAAGTLGARAAEAAREVRPRMRGWLHAGTAPLTLVGGLVLVLLAPPAARLGCAVFALSAVALFTVSATMHRGGWSPRTETVLTRLDHACIFLLIAGSYTPFSLLLLTGRDQAVLLWVVWIGAALGAGFRLLRPQAPRWVYTPIYLGLGWVAVAYLGDFAGRASAPVLSLLVAGGLVYTVGGIVYGLRRPNPVPQWFGFHEVFHALTVVAFAAHYAGVFLAASSAH